MWTTAPTISRGQRLGLNWAIQSCSTANQSCTKYSRNRSEVAVKVQVPDDRAAQRFLISAASLARPVPPNLDLVVTATLPDGELARCDAQQLLEDLERPTMSPRV